MSDAYFLLLIGHEGDRQRCTRLGDGWIFPVSPIGRLVHICLHLFQVSLVFPHCVVLEMYDSCHISTVVCVCSKLNSDPSLRHNFMNIDDPAGTPTMSDKSVHFNMA